MIGISPAYFISKYSSKFTLENVISEMKWLSENNFTHLQLEIFHYEQLDEWYYLNCKKIEKELKKNNLKVSQFVAHFLLSMFLNEKALRSNEGLEELSFIASLISFLNFTDTITIPLTKFDGNSTSPEIISLFDIKLQKILEIGNKYGMRIALEPQPESLAADLTYLTRFENLGLNLDPGHLLCSGIDPFNLDNSILSKVYATHLCENDGIVNRSECPGNENYNWEKLLIDLNNVKFNKSLDIEIICDPVDVEKEYNRGRFFLTNFCIQNNIYAKESIDG